MKRIDAKSYVLVVTAASAMMLFIFQCLGTAAAQTSPSTVPPGGGHGTSRGGSYPVKAIVKLNDQPVAGITVSATAKKSTTAVTDDNGVAAFLLVPGTYTFTATNDSGTATAKAKVIASTKPVVVQLPLAPKAQ